MTDETPAAPSAAAVDGARPAPSLLIPRPWSLTILAALGVVALVAGLIAYSASASSSYGGSISGMIFGVALLIFGGMALIASMLGTAIHAIMQAHLKATAGVSRRRD